MKKLLAATLLALSLTACSDRTPQIVAVPAAQLASPGVMTVTGTATLEVSPDCADLTMTLSSDAARPGVAAAAVAGKQEAVIAAMKKLGIETSSMKISHLTLNPIYKEWPQITVATYRAEITITVTTKKFDQVAAMMEAGANAGATTMSSQFRRSDLPALKKQVRELALRAAKEKAELTAKALGIELGRITTVAETPAGHLWQSHLYPNYLGNVSATAAASQSSALAASLQPLTLDITIGFELTKDA